MLKWLLETILIWQIPTAVLLPANLAVIGTFAHIKVESERMEAVMDDCTIYTCDYTDYNPEWFWGEQDGNLNFHELIGASPEVMRNNWHMEIKQIRKDEIEHPDYTLVLYFRQDICLRADYYRPCDRHFCDRYGQGDSTCFHLYSELVRDCGVDMPIDFDINYYESYNRQPQMLIQAKTCGGAYPYFIDNKCRVFGAGKIREAYIDY